MNINYQDIVKLSDGIEYVVASKVEYNGANYIYLVDLNKKGLKFAEVHNDCISEIDVKEEPELIDTLIPLFYQNTIKDIDFGE